MKRTAAEDCTDPVNHRLSPAYTEGEKAFRLGTPENCPYSADSGKRTAWWTGWLDARTRARFGGMFKRRGITWP